MDIYDKVSDVRGVRKNLPKPQFYSKIRSAAWGVFCATAIWLFFFLQMRVNFDRP